MKSPLRTFGILAALLLLLPFGSAGRAQEEEPALAPEFFSFAILADPHISGKPEPAKRLNAAVKWLNKNRVELKLDLVLVVGDIVTGKGLAAKARRLLEKLAATWVPIIGDNEVESGCEEEFHRVFNAQYKKLARKLEDFHRTPIPAHHPDLDKDCWLQNFAFTHKGVIFIALDWCTRAGGEEADLNDFPGGTFPWFAEEVEKAAASGPGNHIVLHSHLPMHVNPLYEVFSTPEQARVDAVTMKFADAVYADFAGHYHLNWQEARKTSGHRLYVTDATWDDRITLRIVKVTREEDGPFAYKHRMVVVPHPDAKPR